MAEDRSFLEPRALKRGGVALVVGQVTQVAVAFGANLVLVRYISPSEFGSFVLVVATASLLVSVASLRANFLIIRTPEAALGERRRQLYGSVITLETLIAVACGLLLIYVSGYFSAWPVVLTVVICAQHWLNQTKAFYERQMRYVPLGIMEAVVITLGHLTAVAVVLLGGGLHALYIRELVTLGLMLAGLHMLGGLSLYRLRWPDPSEWRFIMREVRGIWADGALEAGYQRLLILLAGVLGGEKGAGFFFQAFRLAFVPNQLATPVTSRLFGTLMGRIEDDEARQRIRDRVLKTSAPLFAVCAVLVILFADPVVPWLFGEPWRPTVDVFVMLAGFVLFSSLFDILRNYCIVAHRLDVLLAGRLAQFAGLGIALAIGFGLERHPDVAWLGLGVSLGAFAAFSWVFIRLRLRKKDPAGTPGR